MSIPLADCAIYGFITLCLKEREETWQEGRGEITGPGPPHLKNKKKQKAKKMQKKQVRRKERNGAQSLRLTALCSPEMGFCF